MSSTLLEALAVAVVVAVTCALPGVFLVLRRMAMVSDAITHTVLLGIVLAFFLTRDLASPLLLVGATVMGVVTVSLVELLNRTGLVREDAAIGLVFPVLFSIGVLLISLSPLRDIHLDTDAVLYGDLTISVQHRRLLLWGRDFGPKVFWVILGILLLNVAFISIFYKELKLATFDAGLAAALGFSPALLHYALMTLVSVTAVGVFDAVGSVLVVCFMIVPPAAAYLFTDRLYSMLFLSALIAVLCAVSGFWLAFWLSSSIPGAMATMAGLGFALAFLFAPERGLVALALRRMRQRWEFAQTMLAIHLFNHENLPEAEQESRIDQLHEHLRWTADFVANVVGKAEREDLVYRREGHLALTEAGRQRARQAIVS